MPNRKKVTPEAIERVHAIMTGENPPDSATELTRRYNAQMREEGGRTLSRPTLRDIMNNVMAEMTGQPPPSGTGGRPSMADIPLVLDRVRQLMEEAQRHEIRLSAAAGARLYNARRWPQPDYPTISHPTMRLVIRRLEREQGETSTVSQGGRPPSLTNSPLVLGRVDLIIEEAQEQRLGPKRIAKLYNERQWPEPDHPTIGRQAASRVMRRLQEEQRKRTGPLSLIRYARRYRISQDLRNPSLSEREIAKRHNTSRDRVHAIREQFRVERTRHHPGKKALIRDPDVVQRVQEIIDEAGLNLITLAAAQREYSQRAARAGSRTISVHAIARIMDHIHNERTGAPYPRPGKPRPRRRPDGSTPC